jgi:hypothetical protein
MAKILLATPVLDGRVDLQFASGLIGASGLYHGWATVDGISNISAARDALAAQFLDSDCDCLIFIDSDIGFETEDLRKLIATHQSLVGGLYTRKTAGGRWLFTPLPGQTYNPSSRVEVVPALHVPAGFLKIDRAVFESLRASGHCPSYRLQGRKVTHFFPTVVEEGSFLSEDYGFCELAASVGHVPHLHTGCRVKHIGRQAFVADVQVATHRA